MFPPTLPLIVLVVTHAAALGLILLVALAAGTAVAGARMPLSLRAVLGLAVAGQLFIVLGIAGALRPVGIWLFVAVALVCGAVRAGSGWWRGIAWKRIAWVAVAVLPLLLLALQPPLAFDETLYHLPLVHWMVRTGLLTFRPDVRNPLFPELHEALCAPLFLALGDQATHLVALAEALILAGLLIEWPRPERRLAGFLAAAIAFGSPILIHMATITYVDLAAALLLAAGFRCLDGSRDAEDRPNYPALAGFLFGAACCVKYYAWYFAAGGVLFLLLFGPNRRRAVPLFSLTLLCAVLPTYGLLVHVTGNPFFPYSLKTIAEAPRAESFLARKTPMTTRAVDGVRILWDATFARQRLNRQPPYSPLFGIAFLVTVGAASRDRRALFLTLFCAGYLAIFTYLPQDSRYLLTLLPLLSIVAATAFVTWLGARPSARKLAIAVCLVAIAPGVAYAGYRLVKMGLPPATADQRRLVLEQNLPAYRAFERRGPGRIYVCGAEQLKYYGGEEMFGDVVGPYSEESWFGATGSTQQLVQDCGQLRIRYLLLSHAACPSEWRQIVAGPHFERVYADDGAELWRVFLSPTDSR